MKIQRYFAFLLLLVSLSGCAHILAGVKDLGLTANDRKALLGPEITYFHNAVASKKVQHALQKVADESREEVKQQIRRQIEAEHLVDFKVHFVDFNDQATEATVEVSVQYFIVPRYIVVTRIEREVWKFTSLAHWKMHSRVFVEPIPG